SDKAVPRRVRSFLRLDAYDGCEQLFSTDPVTHRPRLAEVACWAHARRGIYEVAVSTGSAIANQALERIAALFEIEAGINGRRPEERLCRAPAGSRAAARRAAGLPRPPPPPH